MTVQNQNVKNVYRGNGSTTVFPFTFAINESHPEYIHVYITNDGGKAAETTDFTCDMETRTITYPKVSSSAPKLSATQRLTIYRLLPYEQNLNLVNQGPFFSEDVETQLDDLEMQIQQLSENLVRCFQIGIEALDFDMTMELEPGKVICVNSEGNGFEAREALMEVNGHWDGEGRQIKGVADPTSEQDAATKNYVDTLTDNNFMKLQPDGSAWEARNLPISNVAGPALVKDAANKDYVDRILAGYSGQGDRFVFFDNVEQMQLAKPVPSQMAVTLGYHDVNDGGAGVYTIRDKGADTPDGGSIIEIIGTDYVAELITDDEVNINQFGGKGDGTTDDNVAIVNAVAYASAKKVALRFLDGKTYYTSVGITMSGVLNLLMGGELYYDGDGTALTISNTGRGQFELNVRGAGTAGSRGVYLNNINTSTIFIKSVTRFDVGVELGGDGANSCNDIYIDAIGRCPVILKLNSTGTGGYVNDNKFFGGRFYVASSDGFVSTTIGILITSDRSYNNNNNVFYSPSLELAYPVRVEYGNFNKFLNCRTEDCTEALEVVNGMNNYMSTFMGTSSSKYSVYENKGNMVDLDYRYPTNAVIERLTRVCLCDTGNIAMESASNDTTTSFPKMQRCGKGTLFISGDLNYFHINNSYLLIKNRPIGFVVDTTASKSFVLTLTLQNYVYRPVVFMWDGNGTLLGGSEYSPVMQNTTTMSYASESSAGQSQYGYVVGNDINSNRLVFDLPNECAKAFIGIIKGAGVSEVYVSRMQLYAPVMCDMILGQNHDHAVLDSIPTAAGVTGQFVKKTTPTQGEIGWVYDGTNWIAVG